MAGGKSYVVELVSGHKITRRGLAFLICQGDQDVNAKVVFDMLIPKREREIRTRFDHWLDGGTNKKWFHGWPDNPNYKDCFVFKWRENRQHHRFYGFLCHPLPLDLGFQFCVLVSHAKKNTWETNPSELDRLNEIKIRDGVRTAITKATKTIVPQSPS
ncbi:MAG: hypothetical protein V1897_05990 [Pseudomonadota bacterium]